MKQIAFAALMTAGIQASWQDLWITVDGQMYRTKFKSREWSTIEDDEHGFLVEVPNNNSLVMMEENTEQYQTAGLRGGAIEYKVDLSSVESGCVAGFYGVTHSDSCNPAEPLGPDGVNCTSVDIMQANKYGFNTAAHPCIDGDCDAKSQCEYTMRQQGTEKYGEGAYGPNGSIINTNQQFKVKTEFISTENYDDLWMMRTTLSQQSRKIELEANCEGYLNELNDDINYGMAYVISTWDNSDGQGADFECEGQCPEPASSCDGALNSIYDIKFHQFGYNWDPEESDSDHESDEESEDNSNDESDESDDSDESEGESSDSEDEEPVNFKEFTGNIDEYGDWQFYVKGIQGSKLETEGDTIFMQENNKAFILDHPYDESVFWSYWHPYLGGSVQFDVDVSQVGCGCAAGVYLARLDDDQCTWGDYEQGTTPQCGTVDLMEANQAGFKVQSQPCFDGTCDIESQCKRSAADIDSKAFGPGPSYTIDTSKKFRVKTMFETSVDENGNYTDLTTIKTCLMQDDRQVDIEQDCGDYLDPLTWQLDKMMAMGISVFEVGTQNEISQTCTSQCSSPKAAISNIQWNTDDSIEDTRGPIITGDLSNRLDDCSETGCTECRDGWHEFVPEEIFPVCTDYTLQKYGNACTNTGKFSDDTCNPESEFCLKSYPWGDPDRLRSEHAKCRTPPNSINDKEYEYSRKECRKPTSGLCIAGCQEDQECRNSWPIDDEFKWKSAEAICRCMTPETD